MYNYLGSKIKQNVFPFTIILLFLILTILGISGSSLAAFDQQISGTTPGVILGQPQEIRSDEWQWQSQELLIQRVNNYPEVNKNMGLGQNMSMIVDVPFRSFFVLFKPQNLFFFVMPYKNAFAARWWSMALVLTLGFYFLILALFPGKKLLASLGAILILFNPFTQWWYQTVTLLCIGEALWVCFFVIKIFGKKISTKKLILYSAGLAYAFLCFIFGLYPSFLLPTAYVAISLLAGFFYHRYFVQKISLNNDKKNLLGVASALLVIFLIFLVFYASHSQVIHEIENTVYPGVRNITSGDSGTPDGSNFNILTTFSSPTLFNLQITKKAYLFYANQSEAARIVAINFLILPVILFQIIKKPRKDRKQIDYLLLSTSILACVFIIRLFTPLFNLPFKLFLFNEVQNQRLAIGVTLLCVVQLILLGVSDIGKLSFKKAAAMAFLAFAVLFDSSLEMAHRYPGFISNVGVLFTCLVVSLSIFLILQKKSYLIGLAIFVIFNLVSSIGINPLYDRSEPVAMQSIANNIAQKYPANKSWVVFDSPVLEYLPLLANKQTFSGLQAYPQLSLWRMFDTSKQATQAYNRYAHVVFTAAKLPKNHTFYSPPNAADELFVHFSCNMAARLPNFGYVMSPTPVNTNNLSCLKEDGSMNYHYYDIRVYKYIGN